jgi:hypothetical protein
MGNDEMAVRGNEPVLYASELIALQAYLRREASLYIYISVG